MYVIMSQNLISQIFNFIWCTILLAYIALRSIKFIFHVSSTDYILQSLVLEIIVYWFFFFLQKLHIVLGRDISGFSEGRMKHWIWVHVMWDKFCESVTSHRVCHVSWETQRGAPLWIAGFESGWKIWKIWDLKIWFKGDTLGSSMAGNLWTLSSYAGRKRWSNAIEIEHVLSACRL